MRRLILQEPAECSPVDSRKHSIDQSELERIDLLLKKAEDAKHEALNYVANTSREKVSRVGTGIS